MLGLLLAGPTIMTWGTPEQKERYLAPILTAEEIWCQGFSEPDAGSDLAALKTRAVQGRRRVGGHRAEGLDLGGAVLEVVHARRAHRLRRAEKHKGLTYFLMDMEQDGVEVVPLRQITGEPEFNELFIDGARVPDANVLGGVGNGWKVALTTLMNERAGLGFFLQVRLRQLLDQLIGEAAERGLLDDPVVADQLGELHLRCEVLRLTAYRGLTAIEKYGQPGPEGSLTKWMWSDTNQQLTQLAADIARPGGAARRRAVGATSCCARAATRSRAARPRCSRTSSPSACSACRGRRVSADGLRPDRRPEGDQARRARAARRALLVGARARGGRGRRRYDHALWDELRELGWPGIAVAEEHGGQGLGAVELAVLLEELGYACAATPFLSTAVGGRGDPGGGQRRAARALAAGARRRRGDGAAIGTRALCADGVGARCSCCSTADRRGACSSTPNEADVAPLVTIDPTRRYATVSGGDGEPLGNGGAAPVPATACARRSPPRSSASASARWR